MLHGMIHPVKIILLTATHLAGEGILFRKIQQTAAEETDLFF
jgi:hypothetical protein